MKYNRKLGSKRDQGIVTPKAPQNKSMIGKLILRRDVNDKVYDFSLWDKDGNRLYYSDKEADIKTALQISEGASPTYYRGFWLKGVWQVMAKVPSCNW